ncbi:hypothetical protein PUP68_16815 [Pseudomonas chlororaphis]|uniref:hypothetical protein n=1 Tax=Pseudomonas chlororaphis TaxID=587753 RepID=UPI00087D0E87|nr:hypothetical protein [Pseudomonas chlororaphis]AZC31108.1 hypothetical protein C4K38_3148 [Pseudomonas chlororaphis subsp. piscium]WDG78237.1 hypothetical protein PUP77_28045 [Pseudomonas chlororaphis]WDG82528.1 hypothetical protein PUP68_16815 [Pseudomonas chlororaphis]WDG88913.1 hypothetical protein PUP49_16530 [Pseudomonas chlororaphis]SDT00683.1 hypothetical protein SAMN05216585_4232 [Pseudomonas chlororaphis]
MSYTMSVDRVIQLARCDDFPEAKIREMFAQYNATELPLEILATLPIPLPVKVFLALQDEFFSEAEFRELSLAFAKHAASSDPAVESNHFVSSVISAYEQALLETRSLARGVALNANTRQQVEGYRGAVKALMEPLTQALRSGSGNGAPLHTVAAYEAVWFAGYEHYGIACRNAASCAVAAVPKVEADAALQWVLDNAVAVTQARAA